MMKQREVGRKLRFENFESRHLLTAMTFTVNSVADEGVFTASRNPDDSLVTFGSLRQMILNANENPGPDIIEFNLPQNAFDLSGMATITLGLDAAGNAIPGLQGLDGELLISDTVTITGLGWDQLTIDASGTDPTPNSLPNDPPADPFDPLNNPEDGDGSRVFSVGTRGMVTLSGMTITGADVPDGGGGIDHRAGSLHLAGVVIRENNVQTDGGAGLQSTVASGSELRVSNSTIESNDSFNTSSGFDIVSNGLVTIESTLVQGNQTCSLPSAPVSALPGGTFLGVGTSTLLSDSSGEAIIVNSAFLNNENYLADGGGLTLQTVGDGQIEVTNTTVSGNRTARLGGGVAVLASGAGPVSLRHSTVVDNFADILPQEPGLDLGNTGGVMLFGGKDEVASVSIDHTVIARNVDVADPGSQDRDLSSQFGSDVDPVSVTATYSVLGSVADRVSISSGGGALGTNKMGDPGLSPLQVVDSDFLPDVPRRMHVPILGANLVVDTGDPTLVQGVSPTYQFDGQTVVIDTDGRAEPFDRVVNVIDIGAYEDQGDPVPGPTVEDVIISSSVVTGHAPYSFDAVIDAERTTGVGRTGIQLDTVPVRLPDTIEIEFSEPIDVSNLTTVENALTLYGSQTGNVPTLVPGSFAWDATSNTGSWTFTGWALADDYAIRLDASAITSTGGDKLDGEWVNPLNRTTTNTNVNEFSSGDGEAGGDFVFVAALLPADVNGDRSVDLIDLDTLGGNFGQSFMNERFRNADLNGDGNVDLLDLDILGADFGDSLNATLLLLADIAGNDNRVDAADEALLQMADFDGDGQTVGQGDQDDFDFFNGWLGFEGVA